MTETISPMRLEDLKRPFLESEIEWRIGQSGKKGNGQIWATCLAYVQARAIMDRLDEVCGPENWKVQYIFVSGAQGIEAGVMCRLSIKVGDAWVTKEDGAEQTDIESFKGGISSALKRAAVPWGIGRYLYGLDASYAEIVQDRKGANWAKTKDGTEFYWLPPALPGWALPESAQSRKPPTVSPGQPAAGDGFSDTNYRIPFGKFQKRSLEEVESAQPGALAGYIAFLEGSVAKTGKPLSAPAVEFIQRAEEYLGALESQPIG